MFGIFFSICEQFYFVDNEQLARSGVNCFENLILSNGEKFSAETWQLSCDTVIKVFNSVSPQSLLTWQPNTSSMFI